MATMTTTRIILNDSEASEPPMCLIQKKVLEVTLNGPALMLTIISIIISIQIFQPSLTCTLLALSPIPWMIYNE